MRTALFAFCLVSAAPASAQVVISGTVTTDGSADATATASAGGDGSGGMEAIPTPPTTTTTGVAAPYEVPPLPPVPTAPRRIVGFGTAFGGGIAGAGAYSPGFGSGGIFFGPAIELPTLEAYIFFDDHLSLDVSIPLWNTIVLAAFASGLTLWATNFILDFSIGDDWVRFVVGPELGFSYAGFQSGSSSYSATQINVGALVGVELLTRGRLFGFRVQSRPALGIAFTSSSTDVVAVGGTFLLELALTSYFAE